MLLNPTWFQIMAKQWLIQTFCKLYLRWKRADSLVCRGCGSPVAPLGIEDHIARGCAICSSQKLAVHYAE